MLELRQQRARDSLLRSEYPSGTFGSKQRIAHISGNTHSHSREAVGPWTLDAVESQQLRGTRTQRLAMLIEQPEPEGLHCAGAAIVGPSTADANDDLANARACRSAK